MYLKLHLASASLMHYLMHPACEYASASIDADADARCTLNCIQNSDFGPDWFPVDKLPSVKTKLVSLIKHQTTVETKEASAIEKSNLKENIEHPNKKSKLETKRNGNYVDYRSQSNSTSNYCKTIED
jgi:hypothetical protein